MNRYEEYKKVDIYLEDKIPDDWEICRLKKIASIMTGNSIKDEEKNKYMYEEKARKYISTYDIDFSTLKIKHISKIFIPYQDKKFKIAKKNSTLICIEGGNGGKKVAFSTENVCFGNKLCAIKTYKEYDKFIYYIFMSNIFRTYFFKNVNGDRNGVSLTSVKNFCLPLPNVTLQKQIADYLDWKINEIDKLIYIEKEKIKELEKIKEVKITELYLGKNLNEKVKETKLEWIGKIPESYSIFKLKYLCNKIIDGTHNTPKYVDSGVPFLRVTDISSLKFTENINFNNTAKITKEEHRILYKRCNPEKGDILVSKNGTIGVPKIIDWDNECSIFVSLCLLKLKKIVLPEWIYFYFITNLSKKEISLGGKTGTITNLHLNKIKDFRIPLPKKNIQEKIIKQIINIVTDYDSQVKVKNKFIKQLEKLKESLISEVVTGQIDVRDVVIPEYDKVNVVEEDIEEMESE